jgi:hypothetical protein
VDFSQLAQALLRRIAPAKMAAQAELLAQARNPNICAQRLFRPPQPFLIAA